MLRSGSWLCGLAGLVLWTSAATGDVQPGQVAVYSFAPLIEKAAPAVVNIYTRKIVRSRSAARGLAGSAFWPLLRDTLLLGSRQARIENSLGSRVIVSTGSLIVTHNQL